MPTSNSLPAPKPVVIRLPFKIMGGFIALIFLSIPVMGAIGLYKKYVRGETAADVQPVAASAAPAPVRPPTPFQKIMQTFTMREAYLAVQEHVTDTVGEPSAGAQLLAIWAGERGTWYNVQETPKTTIKLAKKDASEVRGSTICVTGRIVQIQRDTSVKNLFVGTMFAGDDFIHYYAAGPTGKLVDGDRAKFCGMFTGTYSYSNVSGGQTHSIQLVGMFDPTST